MEVGFFLFWWDRCLNSGLRACKAGALLLESHHFALVIFLEMVSYKLFAWADQPQSSQCQLPK
jgi:hypothetical protein